MSTWFLLQLFVLFRTHWYSAENKFVNIVFIYRRIVAEYEKTIAQMIGESFTAHIM